MILGDRMARVKSVTFIPSRWQTFWAAAGQKRAVQLGIMQAESGASACG